MNSTIDMSINTTEFFQKVSSQKKIDTDLFKKESYFKKLKSNTNASIRWQMTPSQKLQQQSGMGVISSDKFSQNSQIDETVSAYGLSVTPKPDIVLIERDLAQNLRKVTRHRPSIQI